MVCITSNPNANDESDIYYVNIVDSGSVGRLQKKSKFHFPANVTQLMDYTELHPGVMIPSGTIAVVKELIRNGAISLHGFADLKY